MEFIDSDDYYDWQDDPGHRAWQRYVYDTVGIFLGQSYSTYGPLMRGYRTLSAEYRSLPPEDLYMAIARGDIKIAGIGCERRVFMLLQLMR